MIKKNILRLCLLLVVLCGFNSCEDDPWEDGPDSTTLLLCDNLWEDYFITEDGAECRQTFEFHLDYKGVERREYMYNGHPDGYDTFTFYWEWDHEYPNSIIMDYGKGDYSYFDDIRVTYNLLTGILDDENVTFNAVRYRSNTQEPLKVRKLRVRSYSPTE